MLPTVIPNAPVAEFLSNRIHATGKPLIQIATELGYDSTTALSMFMQGMVRIPLDKVRSIADALEIDPVLFLKKVMGEYMPETLAALGSVIDGLQLTQNELELITAYRNLTKGKDVSAVICDKAVVAVVMVD